MKKKTKKKHVIEILLVFKKEKYVYHFSTYCLIFPQDVECCPSSKDEHSLGG